MAQDLRAFGLSEAAIAARMAAERQQAAPEVFAVFGVNAAAVRLFGALGSQWRTAALSTQTRAVVRRTGLDYGVIETTARLAGLESPPASDTFARLQIMEAAALRAWSREEAKG